MNANAHSSCSPAVVVVDVLKRTRSVEYLRLKTLVPGVLLPAVDGVTDVGAADARRPGRPRLRTNVTGATEADAVSPDNEVLVVVLVVVVVVVGRYLCTLSDGRRATGETRSTVRGCACWTMGGGGRNRVSCSKWRVRWFRSCRGSVKCAQEHLHLLRLCVTGGDSGWVGCWRAESC